MPTINLLGQEGNAFYLLGTAEKWAKQLGWDYKAIIAEMKSSDYLNLIKTMDKHFKHVITWENWDEVVELHGGIA